MATQTVKGISPLATLGPIRTAATTPTAGQINRYNAAAGAIANTLPPLAGLNPGAQVPVQKTDASSNAVSFTPTEGDAFANGATSASVKIPGALRTLQVLSGSSGKVWAMVSGYDPLEPLKGDKGDSIKGDAGASGDAGAVTTAAAPTAGAISLANMASGELRRLNLTGAVTISDLPAPAATAVHTISLRIYQASAGGYAVTWPASVKWPEDVGAPQLTTTAGRYALVHLLWTGSEWSGAFGGNYA